ncbi:MAG: class I SAM-dependent methyltransferase [Vicinamibacterales bacterium]
MIARKMILPLVPCVRRALRALLLVLLFVHALPGAVFGQTDPNAGPDAPRLNQPGKDVQWVPTPGPLVDKMLDLAGVGPNDRTVDLGSGDGVLVIAAAKRGARARGIEYDPKLVEYSRRNARAAGVAGRTRFDRGDIFETDFSDATVVTTFLLPSMNFRLRPRFLAMKPGTRIVANTFGIGDWQADETTTIEPCERWCTAMLWIVPARAGGTWRTPHGELVLTQRYQMLTGTLAGAAATGRLRGAAVSLTVGSTTYAGEVDGDRMRVRAMPDGRLEEWRVRQPPR